ncbi:hypothetical protein J6590_021609 [Homalodisca vitripennis]|nr:hypothetical protein J6590_021609 [Homalodisca vitripennis]
MFGDNEANPTRGKRLTGERGPRGRDVPRGMAGMAWRGIVRHGDVSPALFHRTAHRVFQNQDPREAVTRRHLFLKIITNRKLRWAQNQTADNISGRSRAASAPASAPTGLITARARIFPHTSCVQAGIFVEQQLFEIYKAVLFTGIAPSFINIIGHNFTASEFFLLPGLGDNGGKRRVIRRNDRRREPVPSGRQSGRGVPGRGFHKNGKVSSYRGREESKIEMITVLPRQTRRMSVGPGSAESARSHFRQRQNYVRHRIPCRGMSSNKT